MAPILFFAIIFIFMIIESRSIKQDIKTTAKSKFSKQDAKRYYDKTL